MKILQNKLLTSNLGLILIICILTFSIYSFSLEAPFKTMDDEASIVRNLDIRSFSNIGKIFGSSFFRMNAYYRPMVTLSYMFEYHFFGLNPLFYNLTNLFIHIATAVCLFFFMQFIFKERMTAFFISLIFAIHPVHWEAVSNIPGRSILLSAFFYIIALMLFCHREKNKLYYVLSLICFVFSLLSKESGGMLPAILVGYLFFIERKPKQKLVPLFLPVLPYFFIDVIYTIFRRSLGVTQLFFWRSPEENTLAFITFLRSVITHLRVFFLPVDLQFDRARQLFENVYHWEVWFTFLFFGAIGYLLCKYRKELTFKAWFFIFWFAVEFFPVSQILVSIGVQPGYISTAEHFMYTPSIGLIVLLVLGITALYESNKKRNIVSQQIFQLIIIGFIGFFVLMTVQQNIYSSQETAMLEKTIRLNPNNARIRYNLATAYVEQKRYREAEINFRKAIEHGGDFAKPRIGLAKTLTDQGKYWEGLAEYEKVQNPGELKKLLENNIRLTYKALENKYVRQLEKNPDNPQLYYSLGVVHSKTERHQKAIAHYLMALKHKPLYKNALFNLASSYKMINDYDNAINYYNEVISGQFEKDELDLQACLHLSELYKEKGDQERAEYLKELCGNF